jgi:hypothetical protein
MSLSTFAYLLGALELVLGIPLLVAPAKTKQWFFKLKDDPVVLPLVGGLTFILCFVTLSSSFSAGQGLAVGLTVAGLVRLLAWLGMIKGLVICWCPSHYGRRVERIFSRPLLPRLLGAVALVLGVLLVLAGNWLAGSPV